LLRNLDKRAVAGNYHFRHNRLIMIAMQAPSTRALFLALDGLYALGLFVAVYVEGNSETASHPGTVLLLVPVVMTVLLFVGQYVVIKRSGNDAVTPGHEWVGILLVYIVFALLAGSLVNLRLSG
jgi:hypothetical protein